MKSPLWIINGILLIVLVALFAFIAYSIKTLFVQPQPLSIAVKAAPETEQKTEEEPQDLGIIYEEHDLFGTYRPAIVSVKPVETLPVIPPAPAPIPVRKKVKPAVQFLEPLPLKITGIIASSTDANSQVSLINTNTRKTESFKIGDKVLDAYILHIFPRKITLVRSNGQQETIYLYQEEAKVDTTNMQDTVWADVIQQQSERSYLLNPTAFGSRIHSLAALIDMLDITTASRNAQPLGLRIGKMKKTSIGYAAGFLPGDIILKVADIAPTTTKSRMKIFNKIISSRMETRIPVQFMRNENVRTVTFTLFNLADPTAVLGASTLQPLKPEAKKSPTKAPAPKEPVRLNAPEKTQKQVITSQKPAQAITQPLQTREDKQRELDAMKRFGGKSATQPSQPIGS
jgi:type II secretory pathway component PulC